MRPNIFHRLIFRLFRQHMVMLSKIPHNLIEPQTRFNNDRFEFVFYDDKGLAYYIVKSDNDMPIGRKVYIMDAFNKFLNAVTDSDFSISLNAMLAAIHSTDEKGRMRSDIATIGYICTQLKHRKGIVLNIDLLTELAALYFFREDESVGFVNEDKTKEKIAFLTANRLLIEEFFYAKNLHKLFPVLKDPTISFNDLVLESALRTKAYAEVILTKQGNG